MVSVRGGNDETVCKRNANGSESLWLYRYVWI